VPLHPLLWSAKLTSAKGLVGTYGVNTKHPRFSVTLHLNKPVSGFFFQIFFPWWTDIYVKIARPGYFCIVPFREKYNLIRLPAVGTLKQYSKALEYEYRVKTAALGTPKRYSIFSLTLYLEWYCACSILYSDRPH
jgi:hypothetical protein